MINHEFAELTSVSNSAEVHLHTLEQWCNATLAVHTFKDYCPNGVQVEGNATIRRLITGVTACQALIEAAIDLQGDAILVHHGYFWKGEPSQLVGMKGARIKSLLKHDISLLAYHLPLDAHATLGNNKALADALGLPFGEELAAGQSPAIARMAHCTPMTVVELTQKITQALGRKPLHLPGGPALIRTIGWCTGAAQDDLVVAHQQGCDAYLSGEVSERTTHEAAESGIHYFACGHHATERGGVQRLGAAIADRFNIDVQFVDIDNPV